MRKRLDASGGALLHPPSVHHLFPLKLPLHDATAALHHSTGGTQSKVICHTIFHLKVPKFQSPEISHWPLFSRFSA